MTDRMMSKKTTVKCFLTLKWGTMSSLCLEMISKKSRPQRKNISILHWVQNGSYRQMCVNSRTVFKDFTFLNSMVPMLRSWKNECKKISIKLLYRPPDK